MTLPEIVKQKLESLPASPGCYVFRDAESSALYVGKAKSLRSRVRSYFQSGGSDSRAFLPFLLRQISDLETIVTASEKEAAILENNLIKEQKPRFNFKLRDDKEYLNLRFDTAQEWPHLELVRRPSPDGAAYFGPYHSATAARRTLHLVEKHFQLRTCSDREFASRKRPCLQYQIKRCLGPCVYPIDRALYDAQVSAVKLFLAGRHDELSRELDERMKAASQSMEFELAARYRDQLRAVDSVRERQRVVSVSDLDQDVLGIYREGDIVELSVLYIRAGRVVEAGSISHSRIDLPDDEIVASFIRQHYGEESSFTASIPDEIIVPAEPEVASGVEEWLAERRAALSGAKRKLGRPKILVPERGARHKLLEMAQENACHAFAEKRRAVEDIEARLLRLQERLRLPSVPVRIECCDISHLGGQDTYGSIVALTNGALDKRGYRSYRVVTTGDGDDYRAMYEVLGRRFRRGKEAAEGEAWELPDLFVVDGGRGQLSVALAAAHDLGLHDLCIVGLAKERETALGDKLVDRVYVPGQKNPISLRQNSPELFLLAMARDEAHRFANAARKKAGKKRRFASRLDDVVGLGPKTRTTLLKAFGSLSAILEASDAELLATRGVTRKQVSAIRKALHGESQPPEEQPEDQIPPGVEALSPGSVVDAVEQSPEAELPS